MVLPVLDPYHQKTPPRWTKVAPRCLWPHPLGHRKATDNETALTLKQVYRCLSCPKPLLCLNGFLWQSWQPLYTFLMFLKSSWEGVWCAKYPRLSVQALAVAVPKFPLGFSQPQSASPAFSRSSQVNFDSAIEEDLCRRKSTFFDLPAPCYIVLLPLESDQCLRKPSTTRIWYARYQDDRLLARSLFSAMFCWRDPQILWTSAGFWEYRRVGAAPLTCCSPLPVRSSISVEIPLQPYRNFSYPYNSPVSILSYSESRGLWYCNCSQNDALY